jgi:hypothetical protein
MNIHIEKWECRLGNNIKQLINVIMIGLHYNYNIIMPYHKFFNTTNIIINENINEKCPRLTDKYNFLLKHRIKDINMNSLFNNLGHIIKMKQILNSCCNINNSLNALDENDIVIHIRSGDIFSKYPHPLYIVPPLSYYVNILNKQNFDNIYLIAEDRKNPCVNELLKLYPNIHFKIQSFKNDIELILRTQNIITSYGTMVPSLLMFSKYIKHIYTTNYANSHLYSMYDNTQTHISNYSHYYTLMKPWKNTPQQQNIMIKYNMKCSNDNPKQLPKIFPTKSPRLKQMFFYKLIS